MPTRKLVIESYFIEFIISIVPLVIIHMLKYNYKSILTSIFDNIGILIGIYSVVFAVSIFFLGILLLESDEKYLKWLTSHSSEKVFRMTAFYSFIVQIISILYIFVFPLFPQNMLTDNIVLFVFVYDLIVFINEIVLTYNYLDLKRKFQIKKMRDTTIRH